MLYNFNSEEPSTICMGLGNQTSDIKKSQNPAWIRMHAGWWLHAKVGAISVTSRTCGTVPTVLLSEKYSCTDRSIVIARHFIYDMSVCSSLTSENFGQNRYRKSAVWDLVCIIQYGFLSMRHRLVCTALPVFSRPVKYSVYRLGYTCLLKRIM